MHSTLSMPLESEPSSAATARTHAAALVESWASEHLVMVLSLLVTELVTNAIVHVGSVIHLEIFVLTGRAVRVEVFDTSFELPRVDNPLPDRESGRGLQLVETLANQWGARRRVDGKVVWFELHENTSEPRWPGPTGAPRFRRVGG